MLESTGILAVDVMKQKDIKAVYGIQDRSVLHYLSHIGKVNGEQDYENKKFVLGKLCKDGELEEAVACLNSIEWIKC